MKRNSRLSRGLHALGHMAGDPTRVQTSAPIAEHAGTNPVVVRRVLGKLREAGLWESEKGHAGGWRLARAPGAITLADVCLAMDESLVASGGEETAPAYPVEYVRQRKVASVLEEIEQSLVERLAATTIAEVRDLGAATRD